MRLFVGAVAIALLAGCSTSPVSPGEARPVPKNRIVAFSANPKEAYGTVVVTRDTGFLGGGCYVAIHIDGKLAARIDTGEVAKFFLSIGGHPSGSA